MNLRQIPTAHIFVDDDGLKYEWLCPMKREPCGRFWEQWDMFRRLKDGRLMLAKILHDEEGQYIYAYRCENGKILKKKFPR